MNHGFRRMSVGWFITFVLAFWGVSKAVIHYSKPNGSPELQMGQRILYQMMGQQTLQKAGFYERYSQATPSEFVSFVNAPEGQVLWPPVRPKPKAGSLEGASATFRSNRLLRPQNLSFSAGEPRTGAGKQIVYIPDDANQVVIVKGYESPSAEPVFSYEFDFPTDAGEIPLDTD